MLAYADGKEIEFYNYEYKIWAPINDPSFDDCVDYYRIKREQKYRPFKDANECFEEMQKHRCYGYVKYDNTYLCITALYPSGAALGIICRSYAEFMDMITFADGEPFGIKVDVE